MLKKILVVVLTSLCLIGCGSKGEAESKNYIINSQVWTDLSEVDFDGETPFKQENLVDNSDLSNYGIKLSDFDYIEVSMSQSALDPSMIVLMKPAKDKEQDCKAQIENFIVSRSSAYRDYNPEASNMIDNYLSEEAEGYYVYIVSNDNNKLLEIIKNNIVEE